MFLATVKRVRTFESLEDRRLLAGDLRITEINYHPHPSLTQFGEQDVDADDYEFIEVANFGARPINLQGYKLTSGVDFDFGWQIINPGQHVVLVQDPHEFAFRYGADPRLAAGRGGANQDQGEFAGTMKNAGERIVLEDPDGEIVHDFQFFDLGEWPTRPDGGGSTLEVIDVEGDYNDPKNWRASQEFGGSPGRPPAEFVSDVVINELLTHTDLPQIDAIELYNRTDSEIDIGGWYISDSVANLFRYQIPRDDGQIDGDDFRVFDETILGFSFRGQEEDNAFLVEADEDGRPIRFADAVSYSATQNGVALGRWENGQGDLFPMTGLTFADFNSGPLIGDIVVSEVHYHPQPQPALDLTAFDLEFVEITNKSNLPINISQWQLDKSVEYSFPTGAIVAPKSSIIVVGFDPFFQPQKARSFLDFYQLTDNVAIYGPYSDANDPNPDRLDDDGESLILQRPEDPEQLGLGYVLIDRVNYSDRNSWPVEADGQGKSLNRIDLNGYGDFALSWTARLPSPGTLNSPGDIDGDGRIDANDIDQLCLAIKLGGGEPVFDVNRDRNVDILDHRFLINDILGTAIGDSNLDGRFDSGDLVQVFIAGEYEDSLALNSGWADGDWNCDSDFNTRDLVDAFQDGRYVAEAVARSQVAAATDGVERDERPADSGDQRKIPAISPAFSPAISTRYGRAAELNSVAVDSLFIA